MRLRWCVLATALVLVVTACGGGSSSKDGDTVGGGLGGTTTPTTAANSVCKTATLPKATEIGVTRDDDHGDGHRRREQLDPARPVQGFVGRA